MRQLVKEKENFGFKPVKFRLKIDLVSYTARAEGLVNMIRSNHIKARIDKTQQNSKCRLYDDRVETVNYIVSEDSKLEQKEYKTRHDWVGKVIHWELCKKLKFAHTNKWYIHNSPSVLENDGWILFLIAYQPL